MNWKLSLVGSGLKEKVSGLKEKINRLKEGVKFQILERKHKWGAGVGRVAGGLKRTGKEMVRVRNDLYFVGSGILGSVGICLTLKGGKCDKDLTLEEVRVMLTALSIHTPAVRLNTYSLLLREWNSANSKEKLKIIKRYMKIYSLSMVEGNSWLSDKLMSEVTTLAYQNYKSKEVRVADEGKIFKMIVAVAGRRVNSDCKKKFQEMKAGKYRYIVFKVDMEEKMVVVESIGMATDSFEKFSDAIPEDECRFAVMAFNFDGETKFIFIHWVPRGEFGSRLIYSGLKNFLKGELEDITELDASEIGLDVWKDS